jgi:hypothetical protein
MLGITFRVGGSRIVEGAVFHSDKYIVIMIFLTLSVEFLLPLSQFFLLISEPLAWQRVDVQSSNDLKKTHIFVRLLLEVFLQSF